MANSKTLFSNYIEDGTAQEKLFLALDNNAFGTGHTIIRIAEKQIPVTSLSEFNEAINLIQGNNNDIYISLNTFTSINRQEAFCFDIRAIYVDLDCHDCPTEKRNDILENAKALLSEAVENGKILRPSTVMDTGRGLSCLYILDRSICYSGNTGKLKKKYEAVYLKVLSSFQDILSHANICIDRSVSDISRPFRLPDTLNTKSGTFCKMYDNEIVRYSLTELDKGFTSESYNTNKKNGTSADKKAPRKTSVFTEEENITLLTGRIEFIKNFVIHMQNNCVYEGYREEACHLCYTFAYSLNPDTAKNKVRELNELFVKPLTESELRCSFSKKRYKYKNKTMCSKLGISLEEAYALGLSRPRRRKTISAKKTQTQKELILIDSLMTEQIKENGKVNKRKLLFDVNKILPMSRATLFRRIDELSCMKKVSQKTPPYDVIPLLATNKNGHPPIKSEANIDTTKGSTHEESSLSPQGGSLACKDAKINNPLSHRDNTIPEVLDPLGSNPDRQSRISCKPTLSSSGTNSSAATGSNLLYSDFKLDAIFQKKFEIRQKLLSNAEDLGMSSILEDIFLLKSANPYKIENLLFNLGLSGKKDLKQFFKELSIHCPDYPTIEGLEKAVFTVYGMTLSALDLQRKTRERNSENWHWRQTNQETWDFIKKVRHSYDDSNYSLLKACQLYSEINYACKSSLKNKTDFYYVSFVDGYIWRADYVKKTLLYHTTVDQLETIAEKFDCEYMQPEEFLLHLALLQDEYIDKEALEDYYRHMIIIYEEELKLA